MAKTICVYAFDELSRVVRVELIDSIGQIVPVVKWTAMKMREECPSIKAVHVVSNWHGLSQEFWKAARSPDFRDWIEFKDKIERNGLSVFVR